MITSAGLRGITGSTRSTVATTVQISLDFLGNPILRILATLEAKTAKISNFWTFWPVIKLIHLLLTCKFLKHGVLIELKCKTSRSC